MTVKLPVEIEGDHSAVRIPIWLAAIIATALLGAPGIAIGWLWNMSIQVQHNDWRIGQIDKVMTTQSSDHDLLQGMKIVLDQVNRRLDELSRKLQ